MGEDKVNDIIYRYALHEAREHINTVELALALLEAFEGMSPHLKDVEKQLNARKDNCEKNMAWLKAVRGQDTEVQAGGAGETVGQAAWIEGQETAVKD